MFLGKYVYLGIILYNNIFFYNNIYIHVNLIIMRKKIQILNMVRSKGLFTKKKYY